MTLKLMNVCIIMIYCGIRGDTHGNQGGSFTYHVHTCVYQQSQCYPYGAHHEWRIMQISPKGVGCYMTVRTNPIVTLEGVAILQLSLIGWTGLVTAHRSVSTLLAWESCRFLQCTLMLHCTPWWSGLEGVTSAPPEELEGKERSYKKNLGGDPR